MTWLRLAAVICSAWGAWSSFRAMGRPVRAGGRLYFRQPDGLYRRWYGGRARRAEEIGL